MRNRDRIALGAIALSLFFSTFAIGSVHRWAVIGGALLALASTVPYITSRRRLSEHSPLLIFLGICAGLTALQVLPLPAVLVELLSSEKYELVRDNASALGQSHPSFFSLSLDPPATLKELVKLVGYLGIAYACLRVAAKKEYRILQLVIALGTAVAVTALAHKAVGATTLFGIYDPEYLDHPVLLSPLLNQNHLCGLMALCSAVALGLAIHARGKEVGLYILTMLLCVGVGLLTGSRGGIVAIVFGLTLTGLLSLLQWRKDRQRKDDWRETAGPKNSVRIAQIVVGVCVLTWLALATGGGALDQLGQTKSAELTGEIGKVELWRASLPIIAKNPVVGIGRGSFEQAITRIRPSRLSHASLENEYLQALVDWGLLGAALASAALVMLGLAAIRGSRISAREAGALGGISALAIHNIVDFSLSLPGVAVPAIAVLAVLTRGTIEPCKSRPPLARRASLIVAGVVLIVLFALPLGTQARDEECAKACTVAEATSIWQRHPGDYRAAGRLAEVLRGKGDKRAIPVLNRALARNPFQWGLHLFAARWLSKSQAPHQALVEYSQALTYAPIPRLQPIVSELVGRFPDASLAVQGLPNSTTRIRYITSHLVGLKRPDVALAYARRLWELGEVSPELLGVLSQQATLAGDFQLALESAQAKYERFPSFDSTHQLAQAQAARGDARLALTTLNQSDANHPMTSLQTIKKLQLTSNLLTSLKDYDGARESLEAALAIPGSSVATLAGLHTQFAKLEKLLGHRHQADLHEKQALELRSRAKAQRASRK